MVGGSSLMARRLSRGSRLLGVAVSRAGRASLMARGPRALSAIPSPPPPWSSWTDYAEQQRSGTFARGTQSDGARPPRLRDLDPTGFYGGYYASINEPGGRGSQGGTTVTAADRAPASRADVARASHSDEDERLAFVRTFSMRPRDVVRKLDEYVIGQESAKRVLAVAICDHYNHARRCVQDATVADAERSKPNVLIVGPTGSGKTFLVRTLARLLRAPFVKADATKFSATGFVGRDVDELVRDLIDAAGGDVRAAEHGVIYVDEVDKLCSPAAGGLAGLLGGSGGGGGSVNTRDVQTSLLKLMEDADVPIGAAAGAAPNDGVGRRGGAHAPHGRRMSTRHVLWIFSGAFNRMHAQMRADEAREDGALAAQEVELASAHAERDAQAPQDGVERGAGECARTALVGKRRALDRARATVSAEALVESGLEPEFIGRLPVRVRCGDLTESDYVDILLKSKASVLNQIADDFRGYGIEFTISETAVRHIARIAMAQGTGARGLVTTVESIFRDLKYELPSAGISHFFVDDDMVRDPDAALLALLARHRAAGEPAGVGVGLGAAGDKGDGARANAQGAKATADASVKP